MTENHVFTDQDALSFAYKSDEVAKFLEEGPLLEKMSIQIPESDFTRLKREYPSLLPPEIYQNPRKFQVFAITFIRGKKSAPGHAKMKIYVEMTTRRVLKMFATS